MATASFSDSVSDRVENELQVEERRTVRRYIPLGNGVAVSAPFLDACGEGAILEEDFGAKNSEIIPENSHSGSDTVIFEQSPVTVAVIPRDDRWGDDVTARASPRQTGVESRGSRGPRDSHAPEVKNTRHSRVPSEASECTRSPCRSIMDLSEEECEELRNGPPCIKQEEAGLDTERPLRSIVPENETVGAESSDQVVRDGNTDASFHRTCERVDSLVYTGEERQDPMFPRVEGQGPLLSDDRRVLGRVLDLGEGRSSALTQTREPRPSPPEYSGEANHTLIGTRVRVGGPREDGLVRRLANLDGITTGPRDKINSVVETRSQLHHSLEDGNDAPEIVRQPQGAVGGYVERRGGETVLIRSADPRRVRAQSLPQRSAHHPHPLSRIEPHQGGELTHPLAPTQRREPSSTFVRYTDRRTDSYPGFNNPGRSISHERNPRGETEEDVMHLYDEVAALTRRAASGTVGEEELFALTNQLVHRVGRIRETRVTAGTDTVSAPVERRSLLDTFHQARAQESRGGSYATIADPRGWAPLEADMPRERATSTPGGNPCHVRQSRSCHQVPTGDSEYSCCRRSCGSSCKTDSEDFRVRDCDYKGDTDPLSLSMFMVEFEDAAEMAGWDYARKGKELRTRLKGRALLAVQSLAQGDRIDFNALAKALCAEFIPPSATVSAHMQLSRCTQGVRTVGNYGDHLRRLAMLAYPPGSPEGIPSVRDRRALERFTVTLSDGNLRVKVLEGKPQTLRQAINIAEEYLAILEPSGTASRSIPTYALPMGPSKPGSSKVREPAAPREEIGCSAALGRVLKALNELTELLKAERSGYTSPEPRVNKPNPKGRRPMTSQCTSKCYRCGVQGHFARACPSNQDVSLHCLQTVCKGGLPHTCECAECHFSGPPNGKGPLP